MVLLEALLELLYAVVEVLFWCHSFPEWVISHPWTTLLVLALILVLVGFIYFV